MHLCLNLKALMLIEPNQAIAEPDFRLQATDLNFFSGTPILTGNPSFF